MISDGVLANATNFNAAFISQTTQGIENPLTVSSTKTSTYTATTSDAVILVDGTSTAFTVNLYTAVGNAGRRLRIKRTDGTFANAITIDPNGSETIDGSTTKTLYTQYEEWDLVSDGSNWISLNHYISPLPFSVTFTGSWVSNTTYSATCHRIGRFPRFDVGISCSGAPTSANLTLTAPTGITFTTTGSDSGPLGKIIGYGSANDDAGTEYPVVVKYVNSSTVSVHALNASGTYASQTAVTQAVPFTFGNNDGLRLRFEVLVSGWNS